MANVLTALQDVPSQEKPAGKSTTNAKARRCATKHFGVRVALVPFAYNGTDIITPFKKAGSQKSWTLLYEVPLLDESIDDTALRLFEKYVPKQQSSLYQVHSFGDTNFTKTRWISILYSAIVNLQSSKKQDTDDWFTLDRRPLLTRLEDQMLDAALQALHRKVRHEPIGIYMLPPEFTLLQLQQMYELFLGKPISKQSFRKKMWDSEIVIPLEETVTEGGRSQPRGLYRFNKKKYYELKRKGFFLDL